MIKATVFSKILQMFVPTKHEGVLKVFKKPLKVHKSTQLKAMKAIRKKTKTWKKYRQTGNAGDHEQYRKALNKATQTVKKAKGDFEIKLAAEIKRDSKSFFSYARSKLRTKEQIGPLRDRNGNLIDEPKLMAIATKRVL